MGTQAFAGHSPAVLSYRAGHRSWLTIVGTVSGGVALIVGSLLPWITLFADLYSYRGIIGWNGRLMLAGGVLAVAGGIWLYIRDSRTLRRALGGLGLVLFVFSIWLLIQQHGMHNELAVNQPMTVPGIGPGLFVASAGALLLTLAALWRSRSRDKI